jgi:hypothetical protein
MPGGAKVSSVHTESDPVFPGMTNVGLTKRELFAAMAMQSLAGMCDANGKASYSPQGAAHDARSFADELLNALSDNEVSK